MAPYYVHTSRKPILLPLIDTVGKEQWETNVYTNCELQHLHTNARNQLKKKQKQSHMIEQGPIYANPNPNFPLQAIPIQGTSRAVNTNVTKALNFTRPKPTLVKLINAGKLKK